VNSENPPPGGNDPARPSPASAPSDQRKTIAEPSRPPLITPQATGDALTGAAGPPSATSKPPAPPASGERPDPATARHRTAGGLPPQPPPIGSTRTAGQAADQPGAGAAKTAGGLSATAAALLRGSSTAPSAAPARATIAPNPPAPAPTGAKSNLPAPGRPTSAKASAVPGGTTSGTSHAAPPARTTLGAGEPEPAIPSRPEGLSASLIGTASLEPKRITPRSPRAALEPDHVPLPSYRPRPSRRARNPLVIVGNAVFTLLALLLIVGGTAVVIGKGRFEAPGPLTEDKMVVVPPRFGMMDIADLLKREGVIDEHRLVFVGGVFALGARSDLKAGEYLFPKRASVRDVLETIVDGKVVQHQITVPEGLTSEQIVARLLESDILSGNIKDVPREGSLLPDSYHFNRGFTREQMIQRMRQAQDRVVREVWERRNPDLPLKTPDQLVILASIIEKETGKPEERTRIAAVFANRLKQKMKLQSDPTIIYGLAFGKGPLGRPLSKADIAQPTPYNTYVIDGLPPGPIANPGRASIEAAANPARTKDLYFAADGTGGHAFAETYDQHLKNVARLRVIEHGGDPAPAPEAQTPATTRAAPVPPAPAPARGKRSASGSPKSAGAAQ
jgi:UPF0755 protein